VYDPKGCMEIGGFNMCESVWVRTWYFYGVVLCNGIVISADRILKKFWSWLNSSKGKRDAIPLLRHNYLSILEDSAKANNYFQQLFSVIFYK